MGSIAAETALGAPSRSISPSFCGGADHPVGCQRPVGIRQQLYDNVNRPRFRSLYETRGDSCPGP